MFFGKKAGLKIRTWLLIFVLSLFSVIRLSVPVVIIIVYCGQAERCLKDPTPVRTQMLSPPATTCTSCARHTGPLEATASLCVWVGQHLAPYGRLLVGTKGSRTFPLSSSLPLSSGCTSSPLPFTLPVTSVGSVIRMWATTESWNARPWHVR